MPLNGHLEWDAVYQPGKILAVGYRNGKRVKREVVETTGSAFAIDLSADRSEIAADGCDVSVVTVAVKDKKGRVVPDACNEISIEVAGDIHILGTGNGDPANHSPERPLEANSHLFRMKVFNGYARLFLQSGTSPSSASVTVRGEGLKEKVLPILTVL